MGHSTGSLAPPSRRALILVALLPMPLNILNPDGNKRRLYLALFTRKASSNNPIQWHTALLVTPKDSDRSIKDGVLFHVVDWIDATEQRVIWAFEEPKYVYARSKSLAGLMFIGKLKKGISDDDLHKILDSAPRIRYPEEDPTWKCQHWVWSALPLLIDAGVVDKVDSLPATGQGLWNRLTAFLGSFPQEIDYVPCCDVDGTEIDPSKL